MKKVKKVIVLAMSCIMLLGAAMPTQAAVRTCSFCGSYKLNYTYLAWSECYTTNCGAGVFQYLCNSCHKYYRLCSDGHLWLY